MVKASFKLRLGAFLAMIRHSSPFPMLLSNVVRMDITKNGIVDCGVNINTRLFALLFNETFILRLIPALIFNGTIK